MLTLFVWDENSILGMNVLRTDAVLAIVQGETKGAIRRGELGEWTSRTESAPSSGARDQALEADSPQEPPLKAPGQVDLIAVV